MKSSTHPWNAAARVTEPAPAPGFSRGHLPENRTVVSPPSSLAPCPQALPSSRHFANRHCSGTTRLRNQTTLLIYLGSKSLPTRTKQKAVPFPAPPQKTCTGCFEKVNSVRPKRCGACSRRWTISNTRTNDGSLMSLATTCTSSLSFNSSTTACM